MIPRKAKSGTIDWKLLNSSDSFKEMIEESHQSPVLVYKHSTQCSISSMVLSRLERSWDIERVQPYFLDLIALRGISNQVADHFGVQHESPQILIIENGICSFHTSHMGISINSIKLALAENR